MAEYKRIHQNKETVSIPRHYLVELAEMNIISAQVYKVLLFIICRIDGERYTMLDFKQISESLGMPYDSVMGAIYELEDQGVIKRGSDIHTSDGYMFCLGELI